MRTTILAILFTSIICASTFGQPTVGIGSALSGSLAYPGLATEHPPFDYNAPILQSNGNTNQYLVGIRPWTRIELQGDQILVDPYDATQSPFHYDPPIVPSNGIVRGIVVQQDIVLGSGPVIVDQYEPSSVPEPSGSLILLSGFGLLVWNRRRRRNTELFKG